MKLKSLLLAMIIVVVPGVALAQPHEIKIGTLYAGSGPFATSSLPQYRGLEYWIKQMNQKGGVYVKAYGKRVPIRLVSYDDQSNTSEAGTLYSELLTRDKVNILVADFGSVLTSVAVPIARVHKTLLFNVTGTSAKFFSPDNPYIVLTSLPTSGIWPDTLAKFLIHQHVDRVAILYSTNDFDDSQAVTLRKVLKENGITPVYDHGVPSSTSSYSVLIHSIAARRPDGLIEFGYPNNDIAFLQDLRDSGMHFKLVFTVFPGQLLGLMEKNVGTKGLAWTYTYPTPPLLVHHDINYGPTLEEFVNSYEKETGHEVNFLTIAGYNAGLIIQKTLATAKEVNAHSMRAAVSAFSGHVRTLDGEFKINDEGAQIGETLPVGQLQLVGGKLKMEVVYPSGIRTAKPRYPAPIEP